MYCYLCNKKIKEKEIKKGRWSMETGKIAHMECEARNKEGACLSCGQIIDGSGVLYCEACRRES